MYVKSQVCLENMHVNHAPPRMTIPTPSWMGKEVSREAYRESQLGVKSRFSQLQTHEDESRGCLAGTNRVSA